MGRLIEAHTGNEADAHVSGQPLPPDPTGPYSHSYRYDVWGNLTTRVGWGGYDGNYSNWTFSYTNNRHDWMQYDAAGYMVNDGGQYTYDAAGRQTNATYPPSWNGYTLQQSYDGDGQRARKVDNGVASYYLRSSVLGGQVVCELDGAGGGRRGYVYMGGQLLALQAGGVYWVAQDPVTKSQRITDATGNVPTTTLDLDPWGGETNRSSFQGFQPHRYTSYERDGNSNDQAGARTYHGFWMRFDQPDPYADSMDVTDPQSFNRYSYVNNDPVNFTDPSGLDGDAASLLIPVCPPGVCRPVTFTIDVHANDDYALVRGNAASLFSFFSGGRSGGLGGGLFFHHTIEPHTRTAPPNPADEKASEIVAQGVEAALQILANGCWNPSTWNRNVRPGDRYFANVQNTDKFTKGWSSSLSIHDTGVKESPAVAYAGGRQVPDRGTGEPTYVGRYALVVKYYPGQGMAVTSESLSAAHVQSVPGYVFGTNKNVNIDWAQQLLSVAPKCKPEH